MIWAVIFFMKCSQKAAFIFAAALDYIKKVWYNIMWSALGAYVTKRKR